MNNNFAFKDPPCSDMSQDSAVTKEEGSILDIEEDDVVEWKNIDYKLDPTDYPKGSYGNSTH